MIQFPRPLLALVALLLAAPPGADAAAPGKSDKIRKCQDATGRWHYGDTAADECERSKITVLDTQGTVRREIAAPLSPEELKAREAQKVELQRERNEAEEQKRRDERLLATYALEQDIIFVRDRKLAQIENSIRASEGTVNSLRKALERMEKQGADGKNIEQTKVQIGRHQEVIDAKRKEQDQIRQQAEADLQRYRELKGQGAPAQAAKP